MLMKVAQFERLFRQAASLDVDKNDLRRLSDFIRDKIRDLLEVAAKNAKFNGRDYLVSLDLPLTKGLQNSIKEFKKLDVALELVPVLDELRALPPIDIVISEDVENMLPEIAGGLVVAYARVIKELDPKVKNPETAHHERARRVFDLLI